MAFNLKPFNMIERLKSLSQKAVDAYGLKEEQVHVGHLLLQGLCGDPEYVHQIDGATDERHTNLEVATITARLADAMRNSGLQPGDHVVLIGPNNIWSSLPFYACHYNGYALCGIDHRIAPRELEHLFSNVRPKLVFCSTQSTDEVQKALNVNNLSSQVVTFQGEYNLDAFIEEFKGNEKGFKPEIFDQKEINAWLVLTSGTTGMPKVAVVSFETLYKNIKLWWEKSIFKLDCVFSVSSIQWISSLLYFVSTPLAGFTRVQTSKDVTSAHVREIINKYKPQKTTFAPYLVRQFLQNEIDKCDMSCLRSLAIAGGALENETLLQLKKKCKCLVFLYYGMTETLSGPFNTGLNTPVGSVGTPRDGVSIKLVDDDENEITEPNQIGELLWKSDRGYFFKEYLNNPEETSKTLTPDGYIKTGDLMSRNENNFYYFHERKKLLIKYNLMHVAPIEIESTIKQHPAVLEAVVVGIPDPDCMQLSTAAVMVNDEVQVQPQEIFALVNKELPVHKRLHGGLFFVKEYPLCSSGKINRPAVLQQALTANRILDLNCKS